MEPLIWDQDVAIEAIEADEPLSVGGTDPTRLFVALGVIFDDNEDLDIIYEFYV